MEINGREERKKEKEGEREERKREKRREGERKEERKEKRGEGGGGREEGGRGGVGWLIKRRRISHCQIFTKCVDHYKIILGVKIFKKCNLSSPLQLGTQEYSDHGFENIGNWRKHI